MMENPQKTLRINMLIELCLHQFHRYICERSLLTTIRHHHLHFFSLASFSFQSSLNSELSELLNAPAIPSTMSDWGVTRVTSHDTFRSELQEALAPPAASRASRFPASVARENPIVGAHGFFSERPLGSQGGDTWTAWTFIDL